MGDTGVTRRWIDKALVGALAAVVALVGVIYGAVTASVKDLDTTQRQHSERITATETELRAMKTDISEIKADVKSVLREVKK